MAMRWQLFIAITMLAPQEIDARGGGRSLLPANPSGAPMTMERDYR